MSEQYTPVKTESEKPSHEYAHCYCLSTVLQNISFSDMLSVRILELTEPIKENNRCGLIVRVNTTSIQSSVLYLSYNLIDGNK